MLLAPSQCNRLQSSCSRINSYLLIEGLQSPAFSNSLVPLWNRWRWEQYRTVPYKYITMVPYRTIMDPCYRIARCFYNCPVPWLYNEMWYREDRWKKQANGDSWTIAAASWTAFPNKLVLPWLWESQKMVLSFPPTLVQSFSTSSQGYYRSTVISRLDG